MAVVLEEQLIAKSTEAEILEYAEWLGAGLGSGVRFDTVDDRDLLWIAEAGLKMPLPSGWKPCQTGDDGEVFYFNFNTGQSEWDHPCDDYNRQLLECELKKKYGEELTQKDKEFLIAAGRELFPRPVKVGSLIASVNDAGAVEVSAISMGGNVLAVSKLKSPDDSLKAVQRRLLKRASDELKLVLPDGRLPDRADRKKPIRELLEMPEWPSQKSHEEKHLDAPHHDQAQSKAKKVEDVSKQISDPPAKLAPVQPPRRRRMHKLNATLALNEKLAMGNETNSEGPYAGFNKVQVSKTPTYPPGRALPPIC